MEHKIGEIVTLPDGRRVEVVKARSNQRCDKCSACFFGGGEICRGSEMKIKDDSYCSAAFREDRTTIIYKEIKED